MRKIGFITDIQYNNGYIASISITIYDEELNQVVTISPTKFNRLHPYTLFQQVEYTKEDNEIKPYIPKILNGPDLTLEELKIQQKSFLAIINNPKLEQPFLAQLVDAIDKVDDNQGKFPKR